LAGEQSGAFHEFARIVDEMGTRRPSVILLENVLGFASSNGGSDLRAVLKRLNSLGYVCDLLTLDARWFVPQSRPRLFVVGRRTANGRSDAVSLTLPKLSVLRPAWLLEFMRENSDLEFESLVVPSPPKQEPVLGEVLERLPPSDDRWWDGERKMAFEKSLLPLHSDRLRGLKRYPGMAWATAYRRTRKGHATWEIRPDEIAGCLRTTSGGSSRQAVVEAGRGRFRVRWMTPLEYARLQGAGDFRFDADNGSAAMFGFGDAVCVPVIAWIGKHYLKKVILGNRR
jgi:DNA (cytosine-5)-methyltransferase 1